MKKSISQFVSIFIISMVAIIILTGLDALWITLLQHSRDIYRITNVADMWLTIENPTEYDMWKIKGIDGIREVEKRLKINSKTELGANPVLTVYAFPQSNVIDQAYITQGQANIKSGAILDRDFAKAHNICIGDKLKIKINDQWRQYVIKGFCISSEHIFSVEGTITSMSDPSIYGFIIVDIESVRDAFNGDHYYNQVEIQLEKNTNINQLQNQLDDILGKRLLGIQKHNDNLSFSTVNIQINQFRVLALVFPAMFFIVTALITMSTMKRIVEEQRNQIGILKALGYTKKVIMWHYTSYGLYIGMLSIVFGCILGPNTISRILMVSMKQIYTLHSYKLSLYWVNIILMSILIVLCTGGVSAYSCYQLMGERPAELLRARPVKKGGHIFLEKIRMLWLRMKFSHKLIARNIIGNKMNFCMSIFGIMGCAALILAAFSLRTTMLNTASVTYEEVYSYDEKLILDGKSSNRFCQNLKINAKRQTMQQSAMYISSSNGYRKTVPVTVLSTEESMIHLPSKNGKGVLSLSGDGVIVTRKQAQLMGVGEGDTIFLKRSNGSYLPAIVTNITFMREGQGIYMSDKYYKSIGEHYVPTALLVKWNGTKNETAVNFIGSNRVSNYTTRVQQKIDFEICLGMITIAAILLVIFGAVLAFVVIYNMGMLNFFERIRDLSTLMVLGFYQKEIKILVLVDNVLSTGIGIILGIPLGVAMTNLILLFMGDDFDLVAKLTLKNIGLSSILTIIFALLVNFHLIKKIKNIDMLEALKSVE